MTIQMQRTNITRLQDMPNVGKATEKYLNIIGISQPAQLIGKDPYKLFNKLCLLKKKSYDPCLLDVFISAVKYMEGGPAKKWWEFTKERKRKLETK